MLSSKTHRYTLDMTWTGNTGKGTSAYEAYERSHTISMPGKPDIQGTSDPAFRGDPSKYSPEDLFLSSLSSCHMLWYLHLCAVHKINVTAYRDAPVGWMQEDSDGGGKFTEVVLHPTVVVTSETMMQKAKLLHEDAHKKCFIANSCAFPVKVIPQVSCVI